MLLVAMICFAAAIEEHALDSANVDVYDSTFNTNRYNYKLGLFVSTTRDGHSRIKAVTLTLHEDQPSFEIILKWYREAFGSWPAALISDGDYALHLAIVAILGAQFAAMFHLYCVWHIAQLVVKHCAWAFSNGARGRYGDGEGKKALHEFLGALHCARFCAPPTLRSCPPHAPSVRLRASLRCVLEPGEEV